MIPKFERRIGSVSRFNESLKCKVKSIVECLVGSLAFRIWYAENGTEKKKKTTRGKSVVVQNIHLNKADIYVDI